MSRSRDISQILGKTDATNVNNHPLLDTSAAVDSAEVVTLITAHSSNLDSADIQIISAPLTNRNLIINGAMNVAQRATSVADMGGSGGYITVDRFRIDTNGASAGRFTMTQTADGPSGFANCTKLDVTTADTSIAAGERLFLQQNIEGQNLQRVAKGTSDAQSLTLSFYVKGNAAATYVAGFYDNDNNRQVSKQFAVTTSWNRITLTFPPDTTGALDDDNAASLQLRFYLHAGSNYTSGTISETWIAADGTKSVGSGTTSIFDSTDRTFFITGIQLEVGEQATPFEHRNFGDELIQCQRYYQSIDYYWATGTSSLNVHYYTPFPFPITMRATPTMTASAYQQNDGNATTRYNTTVVNGWIMHTASKTSCFMRGNHGNIYNIMSGRGKFEAEL
jgi:hypothetical protein